jgi:hypothetical protein
MWKQAQYKKNYPGTSKPLNFCFVDGTGLCIDKNLGLILASYTVLPLLQKISRGNIKGLDVLSVNFMSNNCLSVNLLATVYIAMNHQYRKFETIFPEKELRGHSPNFHIHESVSDLYIPTIDLTSLLQEICGSIL